MELLHDLSQLLQVLPDQLVAHGRQVFVGGALGPARLDDERQLRAARALRRQELDHRAQVDAAFSDRTAGERKRNAR